MSGSCSNGLTVSSTEGRILHQNFCAYKLVMQSSLYSAGLSSAVHCASTACCYSSWIHKWHILTLAQFTLSITVLLKQETPKLRNLFFYRWIKVTTSETRNLRFKQGVWAQATYPVIIGATTLILWCFNVYSMKNKKVLLELFTVAFLRVLIIYFFLSQRLEEIMKRTRKTDGGDKVHVLSIFLQ